MRRVHVKLVRERAESALRASRHELQRCVHIKLVSDAEIRRDERASDTLDRNGGLMRACVRARVHRVRRDDVATH